MGKQVWQVTGVVTDTICMLYLVPGVFKAFLHQTVHKKNHMENFNKTKHVNY